MAKEKKAGAAKDKKREMEVSFEEQVKEMRGWAIGILTDYEPDTKECHFADYIMRAYAIWFLTSKQEAQDE